MIAPSAADLRSVPLFASVPDEQLSAVAREIAVERFPAGTTIVREGDRGDRSYVIRSGRAAVVTLDLIGSEITLRVFDEGDSFGEMALVTDRPRTATVRAATDVEAYVLTRDAFLRLRRGSPAFARELARYVDLLGVDAFLKKASPFARLPREAVWRIAERLRPRAARAGEEIVREGDEGRSFFLIRSGEVEVLRAGRRVALQGPGDCFGEVALLTGARRAATVRAVGPTDLLVLDRADFDRIVAEHGSLRRQLGELVRIRYRAAPGEPLVLPDPVTTLMPFLSPPRRRRYRLVIALAVAAFAAATALARATGLPALAAAAVVVGAFVGPVAYVTYLSSLDLLGTRRSSLLLSFASAAVVGAPVAFALERAALAAFGQPVPGSLPSALLVALIEEPTKVLGVAWILRRALARFQMDGIVFGAAAGMGFAAVENALFGLTQIGAFDLVLGPLWGRALLAPFGHGTWTAIVCATIWRAKGAGRPRIDARVVAAFATAVALHVAWDWQPFAGGYGLVWLALVAIAGIVVLRAVVQRATAEQLTAMMALAPEAIGVMAGPRIVCGICGQEAPAGAHYCVRCGAALRARSERVAR